MIVHVCVMTDPETGGYARLFIGKTRVAMIQAICEDDQWVFGEGQYVSPDALDNVIAERLPVLLKEDPEAALKMFLEWLAGWYDVDISTQDVAEEVTA